MSKFVKNMLIKKCASLFEKTICWNDKLLMYLSQNIELLFYLTDNWLAENISNFENSI